MNQKTPLLVKFLENLKKQGNDPDNCYIASVYRNLFSLIPVEKMEEHLEYYYSLFHGKDEYFGKNSKDCWFAIFHKSVRQCDYFNDCFQVRNFELLTQKEKSEYKFLKNKFYKATEVLKTKGKDKDKLYNDEYHRYLELSRKMRREDRDESINGELDSILWNIIHVDTKEVLYNIFKETFEYPKKISHKKIKKDAILSS